MSTNIRLDQLGKRGVQFAELLEPRVLLAGISYSGPNDFTLNDTDTIACFANVEINPSTNGSVEIAIDVAPSRGEFTLPSRGAFTPFSNQSINGLFIANGYRATFANTDQAEAALRGLRFAPADNTHDAWTSVTFPLPIHAFETGWILTSNEDTTLTVFSVDDPVQISGVSTPSSLLEGETTRPFLGVTLADPDLGASNVRVTLSLLSPAGSGRFESWSQPGGWSYPSNGLFAQKTFYSLVTPLNQIQAEVREIYFSVLSELFPAATESIPLRIVVETNVPQQGNAWTSSSNDQARVNVTGVNDFPTFSNPTSSITIDDTDTASPFASITFNDPDPQSVTFSLRLRADDGAYDKPLGAFTANSLALAQLTRSGDAYVPIGSVSSVASLQNRLRQLVYKPTEDRLPVGQSERVTFELALTEFGESQTLTLGQLTSRSINALPVITQVPPLEFLDSQTNLTPFNNFYANDSDTPHLSGTLTFEGNTRATFTRNTIYFPNVIAENVTDTYTRIVWGFSNASHVGMRAIMSAISMTLTPNLIAPDATREFTITLTASDGQSTATGTHRITIRGDNDAPSISVAGGRTVRDDTVLSGFPADVSDPDPQDVYTLIVSTDLVNDSDARLLYDGISTQIYVRSGITSIVAVESHLSNLRYIPAPNSVVPGQTVARAVRVNISDAAGGVAEVVESIAVTGVEDQLVRGGRFSGAVADNSSVNPFVEVILTDPDPGQSYSANISFDPRLGTFTPQSLAAGGWVVDPASSPSLTVLVRPPALGVGTLQASLRSLRFVPVTNLVPLGTSRNVRIDTVLSTVGAGSSTYTDFIAVSPYNDPSTFTYATTITFDDQPQNITNPLVNPVLADPDRSEILNITFTLPDTNVIAFVESPNSPDRRLVATAGARTSTTDAADTSFFTDLGLVALPNILLPGQIREIPIAVAAVDRSGRTYTLPPIVARVVGFDDPTAISVFGGEGDDSVPFLLAPQATFTDADTNQIHEISFSVATTFNGATIRLDTPSLAAAGFTASGGVASRTGTAAQLQAALRTIRASETPNSRQPGNWRTVQFPLMLAGTPRATFSISILSVQDPTLISGVGPLGFNDNATVRPFAAVTVADPDIDTYTLSVAQPDPALGSFTPASLAVAGLSTLTAGRYTSAATLTVAQVQAALRTLEFVPKSGVLAPAQTVASAFDIRVQPMARPSLGAPVPIGFDTPGTANVPYTIRGFVPAPSLAGDLLTPIHDGQTARPFANLVIIDALPDRAFTATLRAPAAAVGSLTPASLAAAGFVTNGPDSFTRSAPRATLIDALRSLEFLPVAAPIPAGTLRAFTLDLTLAPDADAPLTARATINVTAQNLPASLAPLAATATDDATELAPFPSAQIDSSVAARSFTARVSFVGSAPGAWTAASLAAAGWTSPAAGVISRVGTAAEVQAALRSLRLVPNAIAAVAGTVVNASARIDIDYTAAPAPLVASVPINVRATNRAPALASDARLAPIPERTARTVTFEDLARLLGISDPNQDLLRLRIDAVGPVVARIAGTQVVPGVTTLAPGQSIELRTDPSSRGERELFRVTADDGTLRSEPRAVLASVTPAPARSAAQNASVEASARPDGSLASITRNDAGELVILRASGPDAPWSRVTTPASDLLVGLRNDTATWHDRRDNATYYAVIADPGLVLLREDNAGSWSLAHLATGGTPPIVSGLTSFESRSGLRALAGLTQNGQVILLRQRADSPSSGPWEAVDLSAELLSRGIATPQFQGPLISWVTDWNGLNIGGLTSSGEVWGLWTPSGFSGWELANLTALTNAPAFSGGIGVFLASWGATNITGIDQNGNLSVVWWTPGLDAWQISNFSEMFGGPRLQRGSVVGFATTWDALNVVGLDDSGTTVAYWWVPGASQWTVSPLATPTQPEFAPRGRLTPLTSTTPDGSVSINFLGSSDSGRILRLWWMPSRDWTLQDLSAG